MAEATHGVILVTGKSICMYIAIDSCHVDEYLYLDGSGVTRRVWCVMMVWAMAEAICEVAVVCYHDTVPLFI